MRGFWIAALALAASILMCGGTFLSGNVQLGLPSFLLVWAVSLVVAYQAGRNVDFQSPVRPKQIRTAAANGSRASAIRRLQKEDEFA
jgi:membrane protein implicated in regulation of membrane protease activity